MVKIISTDERSISDAGDSKRISIVKDWLPILGFEEVEEVETAILYSEKYGFFYGAWLKDEQPNLSDLDEEQIENIDERVDVIDESES